MASENKKKKLANSNQVPSGLKAKGEGVRRMSFFTSSFRQLLKKQLTKEND
jgi:hypothetical protein